MDERIPYRSAESTALVTSGVTAFCLSSGNLDAQGMADCLISHRDAIVLAIQTAQAAMVLMIMAVIGLSTTDERHRRFATARIERRDHRLSRDVTGPVMHAVAASPGAEGGRGQPEVARRLRLRVQRRREAIHQGDWGHWPPPERVTPAARTGGDRAGDRRRPDGRSARVRGGGEDGGAED